MATEENNQLIDRVIAHLRTRNGRSTPEIICREVLGLANCDAVVARRILVGGLDRDSRVQVLDSGEVVLRKAEARDPLLARLRYAVIDVETTGLPPPSHRITEVAAVLVEQGKVTDDFSSLVNPGVPIPRRIVRMTGITNELVADAPPFEDIADPIVELLGRRVLVAHNGSFDINFLNAELDRVSGMRLANTTLCTVRMARKLVPGLDSYRLGSLADYFGVEIVDRHRALGDAAATAAVFIRMLRIAEEGGLVRLSQLHNIAGVRINGRLERKHNRRGKHNRPAAGSRKPTN